MYVGHQSVEKKVVREENLSLTKLQEIANMKLFDEPEVLLLSPAGTIENANTAKRTSGFRATEKHFKENVGSVIESHM